MAYMQDYSQQLNRLAKEIERADAILIGAGAGLSTSAGFVYNGERFHKNFADFEARYNFHDMYSGAFYPFATDEEYWAYWSRFVFINRYTDAPKPVYETLLALVKDKNYFVITTNVDYCFQKAGFDKQRLFYTQGDYGLFQCGLPCHSETYKNEEVIRRMVAEQHDMKVPSELVPHCPKCGRTMTMNLRSDNRFVENKGWHEACKRYQDFVNKYKQSKLLLLELGVGFNTPVIIKYPFWQLTARNKDATYVCINYGDAVCPEDIQHQAILINADIGETLNRFVHAKQ